MLTVIREMAARGRAAPRAHGPPAPRPPRRPTTSRTRCSPRCSRWRWTPARRRSSARPSSSTCWPRPGWSTPARYGLVVILARDRRRAARRARRAPGGRPPRAARQTAPAPRRQPLPLLHELHRHRRGPRRALLRHAPRGDRRLGAGRRRPGDAARSTSTPTSPRRPWRCSTAPATCSGSTSPTCASRSRRASARLGAGAHRGRRGGSGRRDAALFEELGAHVVDGGPTLNPSTYEILAGIHEVRRRGGARAAQLAERDHGRRGGGEAVREAGVASSPSPLPAGGAGGAGRARPRARRGRRTPSGSSAALGGDPLPARSRRPRATTRRGASCAATRSGSPARRSSPGAGRARRCRRRSSASPRAPRSSP